MAAKANALGDYLRARREQVKPEDVGLVGGARRRVAGLRREELALLAGISSDYYLRLEQGRDKNPSAQVLDALARALQLDIKATEYLHQLASQSAARGLRGRRGGADGMQELIDQFPMPAIVASRCLDVLAANAGGPGAVAGFRPRDRTSCAGGCWILPRASSSWIGTRRPTSRSAGCGSSRK